MKRQSNLLSFGFTAGSQSEQPPTKRSSRSDPVSPVIIEPTQDDAMNIDDRDGHLDIEQGYHSESVSSTDDDAIVNQESADEAMESVLHVQSSRQPTFDFSAVNPPYDLGEIYEFTSRLSDSERYM